MVPEGPSDHPVDAADDPRVVLDGHGRGHDDVVRHMLNAPKRRRPMRSLDNIRCYKNTLVKEFLSDIPEYLAVERILDPASFCDLEQGK